MERILKLSTVLLIGCFLVTGCSYMSKSGRQQMAYQRYVKKCQHRRNTQRVKLTKQQRQIPDYKPSKYEVHAGVVETPQSVTSGESGGESQ